jgi:outer membrane protein assembly factor BamB
MRSAAVVIALLGAIAVGLWVSGLRLSLDGSGYMPRFVSTGPDYDSLEAHRAGQRETSPLATQATPNSSSQPTPVPAVVAERSSAQADSVGLVSTGSGADEWPDFRGSHRDGRTEASPIRTSWPSGGLSLLWKQPIGVGYASFVVANGRAFTIEQRRSQEVVAAYEVETGREVWTSGWDGEFVESMGGDGPRATPTYHDGHIYALGALGELRCLDASTGKLLWRHNILAENGASNLTWGMSAAPLVVDDKVIVLPGGASGKSVVAYHRLSGELVWGSLDDQQAYTSPMLVTLGGLRQILVVTATRAVGLDVKDGRLLWEYPWGNAQGISVAQPLLLGEDRVFLSASYGTGAAVFRITRTSDRMAATTVWENQRMKNRFTSSVLHEGHIYGLDESILACLDAATGEIKWKAGRYGYGQLVISGDRLIVLTEDGDIVQVRATPNGHEELGRFSAIQGKTWNHPVLVDGRLLVRNGREMAAFDIRP